MSALEVIAGIAIITFALIGVVSAYTRFVTVTERNTREIQAAYLAYEGLEAMRSLRDEGWTSSIAPLPKNTALALSFDGISFSLSASPPVFVDGVFERSVLLEEVMRDGNDDIAATGVLDPHTLKVTVTVAWFAGKATSTRQVASYLTNLFGT